MNATNSIHRITNPIRPTVPPSFDPSGTIKPGKLSSTPSVKARSCSCSAALNSKTSTVNLTPDKIVVRF